MKKSKLKPRIEKLPNKISLNNPDALLATWFGAGLLRPASGTIGSLAAIPFGFAINYFSHPVYLLAAAIILFLGSIHPVGRFGKMVGETDSSSIVVDEVVGMWIAGIAAFSNIYLWIIAFLLFRFFDITKIQPAKIIDRKVKNGFGVMLDDVIAGIYALLGVSIVAVMTNVL